MNGKAGFKLGAESSACLSLLLSFNPEGSPSAPSFLEAPHFHSVPSLFSGNIQLQTRRVWLKQLRLYPLLLTG